MSKPEKMTKLLVPVDFSASSRAALRFAARLAEAQRAELVVLHVVHDPGEAPGSYGNLSESGQIRQLEEVARDMLKEFLARMAEEKPQLAALQRVESRLVVGLPVTRILEVVERLRPQMVVMGSQGRTGLKRLMLGSKAEQIVRLCPVPVTIVKAPGKLSETEE